MDYGFRLDNILTSCHENVAIDVDMDDLLNILIYRFDLNQ